MQVSACEFMLNSRNLQAACYGHILSFFMIGQSVNDRRKRDMEESQQ